MTPDGEPEPAQGDGATEPLTALVATLALLGRCKRHRDPEREGDEASDDRGCDQAAARGPTDKAHDEAERERCGSA